MLNNLYIDSIIKNPIMDFDGIELLFSNVELGVASDLKTLSKKIKNKVAVSYTHLTLPTT